jgi:hypothetical protein
VRSPSKGLDEDCDAKDGLGTSDRQDKQRSNPGFLRALCGLMLLFLYERKSKDLNRREGAEMSKSGQTEFLTAKKSRKERKECKEC